MSEKEPSKFSPEEERAIADFVSLERKGIAVTPEELEQRIELCKKLSEEQYTEAVRRITGR